MRRLVGRARSVAVSSGRLGGMSSVMAIHVEPHSTGANAVVRAMERVEVAPVIELPSREAL